MSEESAATESVRLAQDIQQKYEMWLIGLAVGVLALAVESAGFGGPVLSRIAELGAWVLLLLSAWCGMTRREQTSGFYFLSSKRLACDERITMLRKMLLSGTPQVHNLDSGSTDSVAEMLAKQEAYLVELDKAIEPVQKKGERAFKCMKAGLLLSLFLLLVSRGWAPIESVLEELSTERNKVDATSENEPLPAPQFESDERIPQPIKAAKGNR